MLPPQGAKVQSLVGELRSHMLYSMAKKKEIYVLYYIFPFVNSKEVRIFKTRTSTKRGFPGGSVVEDLPINAGDRGWIPGPGRSHMPQSN